MLTQDRIEWMIMGMKNGTRFTEDDTSFVRDELEKLLEVVKAARRHLIKDDENSGAALGKALADTVEDEK